MTISELYEIYLAHPSVQTDSRKVKEGDLFFALKGDKFNGNAFAAQALKQGAVYAVIDEPSYADGNSYLLVDNVLESLQALALHHRKQFSIPFIAITGSNGKTTTKELIHAVLSSKFKTYTTEGNLNNHIGVPLTLLKIRQDAEIAVIEMGANHIGEIASYCKYAQPTHGLITNCGKAHLEGFGGIEGVRKGKGELFDYLRQDNHGHAFVMWDYDYLQEMSKGISGIIKYGTAPDAHVVGKVASSDPYLEVSISQGLDVRQITTRLVGDYNLPNVLAAVTVGKFFKVAESAIADAIAGYTPTNSRSQRITKGNSQVILDAYNANPSSMRAAIENFGRQNPEKKVLLLGAMAELGEQSLQEHEGILDLIRQYPWKAVVLVGGDFRRLQHEFHSFDNALEAGQWLKKQPYDNVDMLVKGSRSMTMEKVLEQ